MRLKKTISCVLVFCFTLNCTVGWAQPAGGLSITPSREIPPYLQIEIPEELASIEEIYEAPARRDPKLILHIQDAHGSYEAQSKIKKLLDYLYQTYGFKLLFVEGAKGPLNPEYLKFFRDPSLNTELAEELARKGELTGPELYLVGGPKDLTALGIEQADLYRQNYEAFKSVQRAKGDTEKYLGALELNLEALSSQLFSPEMRRLVSEWKKFESGRRDFLPYVKRLAQDAKKFLGLDLESLFAQVEWPQTTRLLVLQSMEAELNLKQAGAEKARLIEFLKAGRLSKGLIENIEGLGEKKIGMARLVDGKPATAHLPRYLLERLVEEAGPQGFYFHDYPAFSLYAGYLILQSELDSRALFEEVDLLFKRILDQLTVSEDEKKNLELLRDERLLAKLWHLELTRAEWAAASERRELIHPRRIGRRLEELRKDGASSSNGRDSASNGKDIHAALSSLDESFETAFEFYEVARKRESVFYESIQRGMAERKTSKAVLITGGFHTEGLMAKFREAETSYGVLMPRLTEKIDTSNYVNTMLQNRPTLFDLANLGQAAKTLPPDIRRRLGPLRRAEARVIVSTLLETLSRRVTGAAELRGHMHDFATSMGARNFDVRLKHLRSESRAEHYSVGMPLEQRGRHEFFNLSFYGGKAQKFGIRIEEGVQPPLPPDAGATERAEARAETSSTFKAADLLQNNQMLEVVLPDWLVKVDLAIWPTDEQGMEFKVHGLRISGLKVPAISLNARESIVYGFDEKNDYYSAIVANDEYDPQMEIRHIIRNDGNGNIQIRSTANALTPADIKRVPFAARAEVRGETKLIQVKGKLSFSGEPLVEDVDVRVSGISRTTLWLNIAPHSEISVHRQDGTSRPITARDLEAEGSFQIGPGETVNISDLISIQARTIDLHPRDSLQHRVVLEIIASEGIEMSHEQPPRAETRASKKKRSPRNENELRKILQQGLATSLEIETAMDSSDFLKVAGAFQTNKGKLFELGKTLATGGMVTLRLFEKELQRGGLIREFLGGRIDPPIYGLVFPTILIIIFDDPVDQERLTASLQILDQILGINFQDEDLQREIHNKAAELKDLIAQKIPAAFRQNSTYETTAPLSSAIFSVALDAVDTNILLTKAYEKTDPEIIILVKGRVVLMTLRALLQRFIDPAPSVRSAVINESQKESHFRELDEVRAYLEEARQNKDSGEIRQFLETHPTIKQLQDWISAPRAEVREQPRIDRRKAVKTLLTQGAGLSFLVHIMRNVVYGQNEEIEDLDSSLKEGRDYKDIPLHELDKKYEDLLLNVVLKQVEAALKLRAEVKEEIGKSPSGFFHIHVLTDIYDGDFLGKNLDEQVARVKDILEGSDYFLGHTQEDLEPREDEDGQPLDSKKRNILFIKGAEKAFLVFSPEDREGFTVYPKDLTKTIKKRVQDASLEIDFFLKEDGRYQLPDGRKIDIIIRVLNPFPISPKESRRAEVRRYGGVLEIFRENGMMKRKKLIGELQGMLNDVATRIDKEPEIGELAELLGAFISRIKRREITFVTIGKDVESLLDDFNKVGFFTDERLLRLVKKLPTQSKEVLAPFIRAAATGWVLRKAANRLREPKMGRQLIGHLIENFDRKYRDGMSPDDFMTLFDKTVKNWVRENLDVDIPALSQEERISGPVVFYDKPQPRQTGFSSVYLYHTPDPDLPPYSPPLGKFRIRQDRLSMYVNHINTNLHDANKRDARRIVEALADFIEKRGHPLKGKPRAEVRVERDAVAREIVKLPGTEVTVETGSIPTETIEAARRQAEAIAERAEAGIADQVSPARVEIRLGYNSDRLRQVGEINGNPRVTVAAALTGLLLPDAQASPVEARAELRRIAEALTVGQVPSHFERLRSISLLAPSHDLGALTIVTGEIPSVEELLNLYALLGTQMGQRIAYRIAVPKPIFKGTAVKIENLRSEVRLKEWKDMDGNNISLDGRFDIQAIAIEDLSRKLRGLPGEFYNRMKGEIPAGMRMEGFSSQYYALMYDASIEAQIQDAMLRQVTLRLEDYSQRTAAQLVGIKVSQSPKTDPETLKAEVVKKLGENAVQHVVDRSYEIISAALGRLSSLLNDALASFRTAVSA